MIKGCRDKNETAYPNGSLEENVSLIVRLHHSNGYRIRIMSRIHFLLDNHTGSFVEGYSL